LQRAGKTVFVTSFVHALLHAKDAPIEAFPFFPWREVNLQDIPGMPPPGKMLSHWPASAAPTWIT
jgi:predicted YcjX-like family ATPase